MDRLSPGDLMMIRPEEFGWREDIGAVGRLSGAGGHFRLDAAREVVAGRLHLVPRFRQVIHTPVWGLGGPVWVDAPHFAIADHVGVAPLPARAGEHDLLAEVERLRRRPFDRSRPLWEMWFLPGLAGGDVGLYVKLHHALADGIAGIALLGAFLDVEPGEPPAPRSTEWNPAPPPAAAELLADNARRRLAGLLSALSRLAHPIELARRFRVL
jgi:hypothetical protein